MASSRIKRTNNFSSYVSSINKDVKAIQAQANNISSVADGSITGSSLSGTTELGTNTIQSSNYAEGLTGWKIDGTGVAEFSDVFVRGDINAYSGTIGYWNISNPGVERHIGSKRLFGTFIESENLGDTDLNDDTGVYVGLYRSYREPSVVIAGAYRKNDIAIIMAPDHGYKNGDKVSISVTGTATYSTRDYTITNKELVDNVAILTTSEIHEFRAGDILVVDGVDEIFNGTWTAIDSSTDLKTIDYTIRFTKVSDNIASTSVSDATALVHRTVTETGFSFSTGPSYVTIIEADFNSFRYENTGQDLDFQYNINFTGEAVIYDENVAGLYLNDYSKALFDHGYFSNEGINYVSAQIYNLIHNPSFEYLDDTQTEVASTAGWGASTDISLTASNILEKFASKSTYGASVVWDGYQSADKYVDGTVNYTLLESSIKYGRIVYFNLDIFSNPIGRSITPTSFTLAADASYITVTSVAHGLKVGDWVYSCDSTGEHGHLTEIKEKKAVDADKKYRNIVKIIDVTEDTFSVSVFDRAPGTIYSATGQKIFKINIPAFDLSEIKFAFDNGKTISIYDILDESTKASWATTANKILTLSPDEIQGSVSLDDGVLVNTGISPNLSVIDATGLLKNGKSIDYFRVPYTVKLSSAKIYQKYKDLDPTSLQTKKNFKILIPAWMKNTVGDIDTTEYMLDSVMLSSQNRFFYGGSKYGSQSWYDSTVRPDTPSIQAPKTWLDIDLEAQTSRISHLDDITFSAPGFSGSLMKYPGISNENTIDPTVILYGYNDDDSTGTVFSSGQYQRGIIDYSLTPPGPKPLVSKPLESALVTFESTLVTSTSLQSTYTQLTSSTTYSSNTTGQTASTYAAMIGLYSDEEASTISVSADDITFSNWNSYDMAEGNRSPMSITFDGYVDIYGKAYFNSYDIVSITRTAPLETDTTSTWTITISEPVPESVLTSLNSVEVIFTEVSALDGDYIVTPILGSTTTFEITTDNAKLAALDPPLLNSDVYSAGGYVTAFQVTHPTIWDGIQDITDDSDKIATTAWVHKRIASIGGPGHIFVDAATTATIDGVTYANGIGGVGATLTKTTAGTITVDGYELTLADRVLVKDQTSAIENGIYEVSVVGDESTAAVLVRSSDYNNSSVGLILKGDLIYVGDASTTLAGRAFINTSTSMPAEVGVSDITFAAFGGGGGGGATYTADAPLSISNENVISMTTGYVWNTDTDAHAKMWVGTVTPTGALNGDVWIQVP